MQTTPSLPHILKVLQSDSSAPSLTPVGNLVSSSVPRRAESLAETSAARGGGGLHLPRLHHLQQPVPTQRSEQTDWQTSNSTLSGTSRREGLGQHHVDHQHQDTDVSGLRFKHAALRQ